MIKSIYIKNFALAEKLEVEFCPNLNIITGETGAGKSVMIEAMMLLLGGRASADYVRQGEKKAIIEGIFTYLPHTAIKLLEENDIDLDDDELIIRREINASKGSSRNFIADSPAPVALLKQLGALLADFHGQHDHQLLLRRETHIDFLDIFSGTAELMAEFSESVADLKGAVRDYSKLLNKREDYQLKKDIYREELSKITELDLQQGELEELESELNISENAELLYAKSSEAYSLLYASDESIHNKLDEALSAIGELAEFDSAFEVYRHEMKSAIVSLDEMAQFCGQYSRNIDFSPERIEEMRQRHFNIMRLVKKYSTEEAIFERQEFLERELNTAENFEHELGLLRQEVEKKSVAASYLAAQLSERRTQAIPQFSVAIAEILESLGINSATFEIINKFIPAAAEDMLSYSDGENYFLLGDKGIDNIEFMISTNRGEEPRPLAEIASGGEISRVMLAIKSLTAGSDSLPILVFDEIDTGVSGRIARKVGEAMRKLGSEHQILAITHLPQIAALGNRNIKIEKRESDDRTVSFATVLGPDDKLKEIAQMLSGEQVTDSAIESARVLTQTDY